MAVYNIENYLEKDGLGFPLNFRRGNPNPLDNSSVWASYEAALNYAQTDPTAYVGQILSVVDNQNGVVTIYSIQDEAGNLEKIGESIEKIIGTVAEGDTVVGMIGDAEQSAKDYADNAIAALVNSAPEELNTLKELADAMVENDGAIAALQELAGNKVDKVEGSRLITTEEATKLEKLVIGEDGSVEVSGTIAAGNVDGLAAWITARAATLEGLSENNFSDSLLEKLNGIGANAQVNVIENVAINGENLVISNKTVSIPVASSETLGLVKSSATENKIAVGTDYTMEVHSLNVNKLVQTAGEMLILDGGSAI